MTIAAILQGRSAEVITVPVTAIARDVVALLADKRIGAVPVMDDGKVVGIFSERDVIYRLRSDGPAFLDWEASRVMTSPPITVTADMTLLSALALMTRRRVRHLPVLDGELLYGVVSIGDLVKARMEIIESEAAAMREYIQSA